MNNQKPEGPRRSDGTTIDFHSMFYTIQGEGPFAGHAAFFIRLAGCNLQCPGCDTEYTEGRRVLTVGGVIDKLLALQIEHHIYDGVGHRDPLVVITGGEPLRQPIGRLVENIIDHGFRVQIESNGFLEPDPDLTRLLWNTQLAKALYLVISPKTGEINPNAARLASAFKYVLDANEVANDGLPMKALKHSTGKKHCVARPPASFRGDIYVNPFDSGDTDQNKLNLEAVAKSCMENGYILGVQLHKLIGVA